MSQAVPRNSASGRPAPNRRIAIIATLAVFAVIAIVAVALSNRLVPKTATTVNPKVDLKVGSAAPDFSVSTTNGPFTLATAQLPVLLEVFATWCPHCQHEVPVLNALSKAYAGKATIVAVSGSPYGIDGSSPENQADVMQFVQKLGVAYPIAFDPDLKVSGAYLQGGYPTMVVIGTDKKVSYINSGELPAADLRNALDKAISSRS